MNARVDDRDFSQVPGRLTCNPLFNVAISELRDDNHHPEMANPYSLMKWGHHQGCPHFMEPADGIEPSSPVYWTGALTIMLCGHLDMYTIVYILCCI